MERGPEAFREVPHYITNSPFFAFHLAQVAAELCRRRQLQRPRLLELGGGSGRFASLFCRFFSRQIASFDYHLTDLAPANIEFCRQHPGLADSPVTFAPLDVSQEPLPEADLIVANYFFGALPQERLRAVEGELHLVETDDRFFPSAKALRPSPNPFANRSWNRDARHQAERLPHSDFLFPSCGRDLMEQSGKATWLLSDKGFLKGEEWLNYLDLPAVRHGQSYSFPVDFGLLGRGVEPWPGEARFRTMVFPAQTMTRYPFGPHDLVVLWEALRDLSLPSSVAANFLALAQFCPEMAASFRASLKRLNPSHLVWLLDRCLTHHYSLGLSSTTEARLAQLYHQAGAYRKALALYPEEARTSRSRALCWLALREAEKAREAAPDLALPPAPTTALEPPTPLAVEIDRSVLIQFLEDQDLNERATLALHRLRREHRGGVRSRRDGSTIHIYDARSREDHQP